MIVRKGLKLRDPREHHSKELKFSALFRDFVFGIEDSLVSTTGVLTGIAGATLDPKIIILSGIVVVAVEATSMGAGSYLSTKSQKSINEKLIADERNEIRTNPKKERAEIEYMLTVRGFTPDEVTIMADRIMSDEKLALEYMVHHELNLAYPNNEQPVSGGVAMFFAYVIAGFIPLMPYFFLTGGAAIILSVALGVSALFTLGYVQGKLTHTPRIKTGLEMLYVAGGAAVLGYVIGQIVDHLM